MAACLSAGRGHVRAEEETVRARRRGSQTPQQSVGVDDTRWREKLFFFLVSCFLLFLCMRGGVLVVYIRFISKLQNSCCWK